MWPFRKRIPAGASAVEIIDEAIDFAAQRWLSFSLSVAVPPGAGLRYRIGLFARSIESSLHRRFPPLTTAPAEVIVLIVAKGVERSGAVPRGDIERELGILLPP
ncbi:hypothetical protein ASE00_14095 [Sphingomonas sp. Root710]|uniref:hypothetical protein n=1 Tax=Sphingomonas sp. Root710 TaxID=1736594 RepID=UPI0007009186|nr:hypothetical protein [Sphingomonas sp. Root710]KRB81142.1 hypothetical protein ASE00_14095 [Sphingomonas sp. Root710]